MTQVERIINYLKQRGIKYQWEESPKLTGPQRRRLTHKAGHQLAVARREAEVNDFLGGPVEDKLSAW